MRGSGIAVREDHRRKGFIDGAQSLGAVVANRRGAPLRRADDEARAGFEQRSRGTQILRVFVRVHAFIDGWFRGERRSGDEETAGSGCDDAKTEGSRAGHYQRHSRFHLFFPVTGRIA